MNSTPPSGLLPCLLEEIPHPALLLNLNGQPLAINKKLELLLQFSFSQLQYLHRIHQFSLHYRANDTLSGEYELNIYGKLFYLQGRMKKCSGPQRLYIFADSLHAPIPSDDPNTFDSLIGETPVFLETVAACRRAAALGMFTLLCGESGTGKEALARCMHQAGPWPEHAFFCIHNNSEFTDFFAGTKLPADSLYGSTLYIDEIANFNHYNQDRLFSLLRGSIGQEYKIICSTSANLEYLLRRGEWHRNLHSVLSAQTILVPPLRQRKKDIPLLANHFLARINRKLGRNFTLSDELLELITDYDWLGNAHELESVLYYMVRASEAVDGPLQASLFHSAFVQYDGPAFHNNYSIAQAEKALIIRALNAFATAPKPKESAAAALGISVATLYRKMKLFQIQVQPIYDL